MSDETLIDHVNRAKARWLKRVMYESPATSTQKCFAYADHLNSVTLDCWPAQLRLIRLLGRKSEKTAQRAGRALETLGLITLRRPKGKAGYRYAPVFLAGDEDKSVLGIGQARPETLDTNVGQSSLDIQFRSSSTVDAAEPGTSRPSTKPSFNSAKRGAIEVALAAMLGKDGMQILQLPKEQSASAKWQRHALPLTKRDHYGDEQRPSASAPISGVARRMYRGGGCKSLLGISGGTGSGLHTQN